MYVSIRSYLTYVNAEESCPCDSLSTGRVAHSFVWISSDCHGIVDVMVISGKQPSSGLLRTLRLICVCVWPLSAVCYNIASSSHRGSTLVFPGTRSHVSPHRLTSTTQPLCHCARVYHNIHNMQENTNLSRCASKLSSECTR